MIRITYSKSTPIIESWREKLSDLVVAFEMKEVEGLAVPHLVDKDLQLDGESSIQHFVDELEKEINDWRTPRCGV